MTACGLDFGTSNTTLGTLVGGQPVLVELDVGQTAIPSAIFYELDGSGAVGRAATEAYVDGVPGRLMRSLKSLLGTSLIDDVTQVGRERVSFRDVIAYYIWRGETAGRAISLVTRLRSVVHGRPVHFVDNAPEADAAAEQTLRDIAHEVGFAEVTFQLEPIAAALDYERQITGEEIALIADIGGGTSDFSIVRLSPARHLKADRAGDVLANDGVRIGGTDFDYQLGLGTIMPLFGYRSPMKRAGTDVPSRYFYELATWSSINRMYERKVMNEVLQVRLSRRSLNWSSASFACLMNSVVTRLRWKLKRPKIALSDKKKFDMSFDWVEPGLSVAVGWKDLVTHTGRLAANIAARIIKMPSAGGAHR